MKPVYQTLFGDSKGNCFSACLAEKYGLGMIGLLPQDLDNLADDTALAILFSRPWYHLISGKGPRGSNHSVVGCSGKMVHDHDPHPDGTGLIEPEVWDFFIKL
jgi:hypothetical protein